MKTWFWPRFGLSGPLCARPPWAVTSWKLQNDLCNRSFSAGVGVEVYLPAQSYPAGLLQVRKNLEIREKSGKSVAPSGKIEKVVAFGRCACCYFLKTVTWLTFNYTSLKRTDFFKCSSCIIFLPTSQNTNKLEKMSGKSENLILEVMECKKLNVVTTLPEYNSSRTMVPRGTKYLG